MCPWSLRLTPAIRRSKNDEAVASTALSSQSIPHAATAFPVRAPALGRVRARASALLSHRRAVPAIICLSLLLTSPYLIAGGNGDDYLHTISLRERPELGGTQRPPWDLFAFASPEIDTALIEEGIGPWWTDPQLTISFYRPLSSLLRWVDHLLWPDDMVLMHLHSLAWFGLLLAAVALLYRGMALSSRHAVLALLLFAIDDARASLAAWVAQRNALIALLPAVLALAAHHRWRAAGSKACAWLAPLALLVGLHGGEAALAVCGYLLAYALVLERGAWGARVRSLLPYLPVLLVWAAIYAYLGRGAQHSGIYIDPTREPLPFARALLERLPILLLSEFALPVADLWEVYPLLARWLQPLVYTFAVLALGGLWLLLRPLLRAQAVLRFWLLGALLATVQACCVHPQDRMLTATSLGGAMLVSALLLSALERSYPRPSRAVTASMLALGLVHMVIAPLLLPLRHLDLYVMEQLTMRADRSVPSGPEVRQQTVILLNPPVDLMAVNFLLFRAAHHIPLPKHFRALATGESDLYVERVDERTLRLRPADGFLATGSQILFRRPARSLRTGDNVHLSDMDFHVTDSTADGRPAEVQVRFREPLESSTLRFLQWGKYQYVPFKLPARGRSVVIPKVDPATLIESPFKRVS
jgi:hypothetical protein